MDALDEFLEEEEERPEPAVELLSRVEDEEEVSPPGTEEKSGRPVQVPADQSEDLPEVVTPETVPEEETGAELPEVPPEEQDMPSAEVSNQEPPEAALPDTPKPEIVRSSPLDIADLNLTETDESEGERESRERAVRIDELEKKLGDAVADIGELAERIQNVNNG